MRTMVITLLLFFAHQACLAQEVKPVIVGQKELSTAENKPITVQLTDLYVEETPVETDDGGDNGGDGGGDDGGNNNGDSDGDPDDNDDSDSGNGGDPDGSPLPADVYFYTIEMDLSHQKVSYKGIVSILR